MPARIRLTDPQRFTLAEIGKHARRVQLRQVACVVKPDTILARYRRLVARGEFDGSKHRVCPGRPRLDQETEALIMRMARENAGWGYDQRLAEIPHQGCLKSLMI